MIDFIKKYYLVLCLVLIIIIGGSLRLWQFEDTLRFNADQARDAQIIDRMLNEKKFPLLGPKAGGTDFKLGPAFYYLEYLSANIFGNNPVGIALITVILGIFSIPLFFIFLKFYFSQNISIILTFLYAISFYAIKYSKFAWNPNLIPFFMLFFLIVLLKISENKKNIFWNILAGIIMGISFQLHVLPIFFMTILFLFVHVRFFIKEKKKQLIGLILAFVVILLFNLPLIIYDFQNEGKNYSSFWTGVNKKSESNLTFFEKFLKTKQFFIQGNFYILTGYEPKNWLITKNLLSFKNSTEIIIILLASVFFIFGLILTIRYYLKELKDKRKLFLEIILLVFIVSFVIFWFLANELNLRFFITLIFLPFVFLGVLLGYFNENLNKKIFYSLAFLAIATLALYNLKVYRNTYDPQNFSGKSDIYGGISLKEARDISIFITETSRNDDFRESRSFLQSFEFSRSVDYFNEKAGFEIFGYNENKTQTGDIVFVVVKNKNADKTVKERENYFSLADSRNIGRFTALAFRVK